MNCKEFLLSVSLIDENNSPFNEIESGCMQGIFANLMSGEWNLNK